MFTAFQYPERISVLGQFDVVVENVHLDVIDQRMADVFVSRGSDDGEGGRYSAVQIGSRPAVGSKTGTTGGRETASSGGAVVGERDFQHGGARQQGGGFPFQPSGPSGTPMGFFPRPRTTATPFATYGSLPAEDVYYTDLMSSARAPGARARSPSTSAAFKNRTLKAADVLGERGTDLRRASSVRRRRSTLGKSSRRRSMKNVIGGPSLAHDSRTSLGDLLSPTNVIGGPALGTLLSAPHASETQAPRGRRGSQTISSSWSLAAGAQQNGSVVFPSPFAGETSPSMITGEITNRTSSDHAILAPAGSFQHSHSTRRASSNVQHRSAQRPNTRVPDSSEDSLLSSSSRRGPASTRRMSRSPSSRGSSSSPVDFAQNALTRQASTRRRSRKSLGGGNSRSMANLVGQGSLDNAPLLAERRTSRRSVRGSGRRSLTSRKDVVSGIGSEQDLHSDTGRGPRSERRVSQKARSALVHSTAQESQSKLNSDIVLDDLESAPTKRRDQRHDYRQYYHDHSTKSLGLVNLSSPSLASVVNRDYDPSPTASLQVDALQTDHFEDLLGVPVEYRGPASAAQRSAADLSGHQDLPEEVLEPTVLENGGASAGKTSVSLSPDAGTRAGKTSVSLSPDAGTSGASGVFRTPERQHRAIPADAPVTKTPSILAGSGQKKGMAANVSFGATSFNNSPASRTQSSIPAEHNKSTSRRSSPFRRSLSGRGGSSSSTTGTTRQNATTPAAKSSSSQKAVSSLRGSLREAQRKLEFGSAGAGAAGLTRRSGGSRTSSPRTSETKPRSSVSRGVASSNGRPVSSTSDEFDSEEEGEWEEEYEYVTDSEEEEAPSKIAKQPSVRTKSNVVGKQVSAVPRVTKTPSSDPVELAKSNSRAHRPLETKQVSAVVPRVKNPSLHQEPDRSSFAPSPSRPRGRASSRKSLTSSRKSLRKSASSFGASSAASRTNQQQEPPVEHQHQFAGPVELSKSNSRAHRPLETKQNLDFAVVVPAQHQWLFEDCVKFAWSADQKPYVWAVEESERLARHLGRSSLSLWRWVDLEFGGAASSCLGLG